MIDLFTNDDYYAFICQMRDDPEDNVVRLVCADWLEERGFEDRAKYIRFSLEKRRHNLWSDADYHKTIIEWSDVTGIWPRMSWPDSASKIVGCSPTRCEYIWSRGFIEEIWMTTEQWVLYGPKICRVHPIQKGHLESSFGYGPVCLPRPLPDGSNL